jgi:hypothetical protein
VIIVITAVRIPWTLKAPTSETIRITWTTGEFLAATFVANAPTLYSFRKRFERRKSRSSNNVRSPPRIGPVPLNDFDSTVKTRTQGGDRAAVGEGSNDTGETLVGWYGSWPLSQGIGGNGMIPSGYPFEPAASAT